MQCAAGNAPRYSSSSEHSGALHSMLPQYKCKNMVCKSVYCSAHLAVTVPVQEVCPNERCVTFCCTTHMLLQHACTDMVSVCCFTRCGMLVQYKDRSDIVGVLFCSVRQSVAVHMQECLCGGAGRGRG